MWQSWLIGSSPKLYRNRLGDVTRFVSSCSAGVLVLWKTEKVEKCEALNYHWKQEKEVVQGNFLRDYYQVHSRGSFRTQSNIQDGVFCKNSQLFSKELHLRGWFSDDYFNSLNRNKISSRMSSDNNVKIEYRLYVKISSDKPS